jgi:hypothetical protein
MASWGCPHEIDGRCSKIMNLPCDPGMKGCVLAGRYFFLSSDDKNQRLRQARAAADESDQSPPGDDGPPAGE